MSVLQLKLVSPLRQHNMSLLTYTPFLPLTVRDTGELLEPYLKYRFSFKLVFLSTPKCFKKGNPWRLVSHLLPRRWCSVIRVDWKKNEELFTVAFRIPKTWMTVTLCIFQCNFHNKFVDLGYLSNTINDGSLSELGRDHRFFNSVICESFCSHFIRNIRYYYDTWRSPCSFVSSLKMPRNLPIFYIHLISFCDNRTHLSTCLSRRSFLWLICSKLLE